MAGAEQLVHEIAVTALDVDEVEPGVARDFRATDVSRRPLPVSPADTDAANEEARQ